MIRRIRWVSQFVWVGIVCLLLDSCVEPPTIRIPDTSYRLLDHAENMQISEKTIEFDFRNTIHQNVFKDGWLIDAARLKPLTQHPILNLPLENVRDRILRIKLDSSSPVTINGHIGTNALSVVKPVVTGQTSVFDMVLSSDLLIAGINRLMLDITPHESCSISKISVLEGAARVGYAAVREDIRTSLIGFPNVSVSFPVVLDQVKNTLAFEYGLDDYGHSKGSTGGRIRTRVRASDDVQTGEWIEVRAGETWNSAVILIESRFAGRECRIEFEFDPGTNGDPTGDLIAIAEPRIVGTDAVPETTDLPSIILMTLDSCRIDRLGFGGDHLVLSPALDRLARDGFVFSDCICQINNTPPSHYTILTSKRPRTHGVYDMVTPLNPLHSTVARLLTPHHYRCAAATSAAWLSARTHGLGPGFERYYAPGEAQRRAPVTYGAIEAWLTERARESTRSPFFSWIHFFDPHTPLDPPAPYDQIYYSGNPRDPANRSMEHIGFSPEQVDYMKSWIQDITDLNYLLAQYRSEITYMDSVIEKLRCMLAQTGADRNTWIIITADHGISLDEHGLYFIMAGMYEQQMHIPLLIVPPRGVKAGMVFDQTVQSLDIAPTIMSIARQTPPDAFEGRDLLPLLNGGNLAPIARVISEHANNQAVMVRESQYKYIKYIGPIYYNEPEIGIYDLQHDAMERVNLHGTLPVEESKLDNRVTQFTEIPIGQAETGAAYSRELEDKLEALGYISTDE